MPRKDPEKRKEYNKKYHEKNKEKELQRMKEYYEKHKEEILQQRKKYNEKNSEKKSQYMKEYLQTPEGKKSLTISQWKRQDIIFHDWDLLYNIYMETTHCDNCNVFLQGRGNDQKCLDHDHSITDDENVRNVLCSRCNIIRG